MRCCFTLILSRLARHADFGVLFVTLSYVMYLVNLSAGSEVSKLDGLGLFLVLSAGEGGIEI